MIVYGPVPSRRLGRSLGINNIPPKVCSYACAYCQVGNTLKVSVKRKGFYPPEEIISQVRARVVEARTGGEKIDFLSFVPDGEPTLDIHLAEELNGLRELEIPLAVISNGSLLADAQVRIELASADWVSLKVDAVDSQTWRKIDRPHRSLDLEEILRGFLKFRQDFGGVLVTETMLVGGLNDTAGHADAVAEYLVRLQPDKAYLSIPTRPPARSWVSAPSSHDLLEYFQTLESRVPRVEWLIGYEGNDFSAAGSPAENILNITAVHPMREEAVRGLLHRAGADWSIVENLLESRELETVTYEGHVYMLRRPLATGA